MNVLVTGGTGFIGSVLCRELADRGHNVDAMARSTPDDPMPDDIAVVTGDVRDAESVTSAVEGHDAVINLVSLSPLFKQPSGLSHDAVHRLGTQNLVEASTSAGVVRFVQMSALGADPDAPTAYLRAKGEAEDLVRDSDLEWTIVRPSVVFGDGSEFVDFTRWVSFPPMLDRLWWPYASPLPGASGRFQPIWVEDLVDLMADMLKDEDTVGATYELGGPAVLTLAEIVRLIHRAEGKRAWIVPIPTALAKPPLYIGEYLPGFPLGADQGRSLDIDNVPTSNDVSQFGRDPADLRSLADYLSVE